MGLNLDCLAITAEKAIEPTKMQSVTTKKLVEMLSSRHYREQAVDDALSQAFLEKYLASLDPARMFFLAADVEEFLKHKNKFDDDFKSGDLTYGFTIYERYRQRLTDRLEKVVAALSDPKVKFSFDKEELVEIDREKSPWPTTAKEANELWDKRLRLSLLNQKLSGKEPEKARETLLKRYQNQLKRVAQQSAADVYESMINSLTLLYDPHTNYFSPRTSENFNINMSLSLEGIGAVLQSEDEHTKVVRLVAGGPAHKQGQLKPTDRIVGVGQGDKGEVVDVVGWRLDEVVDLIRGKKGTIVKLEVLTEKDESRFVSIKRDQVKLEDQAAQKAILDVTENGKTHKVGVIDIPAFYIDFKAARAGDPNYRSTTRDVARLVSELKADGVEGIVLDLRNNGGGSLQEATQLTDLFIDQGPVVQIRSSDGRVARDHRAYSSALYSGPLVVLINRLSASASEIFAGAIQDYQRGLVVGSQSFGKGTVQLLTRMPEGELKLTESKFYRVSGESTQHRGVVPDIHLPIIVNHDDVGESAYDNALPWDTIHAAAHARYFDFSNILPSLTKKHNARIKDNPDFIFIKEQFALSNKNSERTHISLNEKTRNQEKKAIEEEALAIENKRRIAKKETPFKDVQAYKDFQEAEEKERDANYGSKDSQIDVKDDALLTEAGFILLDLATALYSEAIAIRTPLQKKKQ
ncbi:carboxy terminal-processing peptidase [Marinagarivorans cellulosilyticus]|uniref:Carboxyl-terminal processing protease n=1 Tax=Marinagarivorans cellulosilyticus TaxID=2721545 RepID=A0AAN1WJ60_9GAMM|nr:carboxyl-terminal processing protease [Marinagarivorans cellulosilyticus]